MRIAQLSTSDTGGAGRAAARLNSALELIGVDSTMFVKYKCTKNKRIQPLTINNKIYPEINNFNNYYFNGNIYPGNTMISTLHPSHGFEILNRLNDFDIVNLHWITQFISLEQILYLRSKNKRIVWTLHDQNPMTGVCHYTHGCNKYLSDCDNCPQMKRNKYNYSKIALEAKIKYLPKDIVIVSPSTWLAECAKKSKVFNSYRIEVIPNSIECDLFKPTDKKEAKMKLGINPNANVILFGAEYHSETRKGFKELLEAIWSVKEALLKENSHIMLFGSASDEIKQLGLPIINLGFIKDDQKLALAYSAANVVALPSLEDNLPNIILEALACNTPVIGFNVGGMPDAIINGKTGYIVPFKDTKEFGNRICEIISNNHNFNCRETALEKYNSQIQARSYNEIYMDILKDKEIDNGKLVNQNIPYVFPEIGAIMADFIIEDMMSGTERIGILDITARDFLRKIKRMLR